MTQPNSTDPLTINAERLRDDLNALASIGADPETRGIYRMAFSEADWQGREWFIARCNASGLSTRIDGAGNVIARLDNGSDAPAVIMGSHLDTVPCAGGLDGALGVLCGLETARCLKENNLKLKHPVEVIAFSDEEGRFGGMLGSQAFCGRVNPDTLNTATDLDGIRLWDAMLERGLNPLDALSAHRDHRSVLAFLELHIEQGPVLDQSRTSIGVVESITGLRKWSATFSGTANHAGTTPMTMRKDAFMGLADFAHEIPRVLDEYGGELSRATIGKALLHPGSPNTVPGKVEFTLDFRDPNDETLDLLADAFRRALLAIARRRGLNYDFEEISRLTPVTCDERLTAAIETEAHRCRLSHTRMPSGAAHDAQIIGEVIPTAMIFVPSRDGLSHSPAEWTPWEDIVAGAQVLLQATATISTKGL